MSGEGMRRGIGHFRSVLLALAGFWTLATPAFGQGLGTVGGPAQGLGTVGGPIAPPIQPPPPQTPENTLLDFATYVSFIDSALPRSQARVLFDFADHIRQPTRAEYFQPKGGLPGSPGPPLPETNVNYSQMTSYGEVAIFQPFSAFISTPLRIVDADVNKDPWGMGDVEAGFKWAFVNTANLVTTFQCRLYLPTATNSALGTEHVSVEPAVLGDLHLLGKLTLEGEIRYWVPIGGTDFAGDILRYGAGVSYKFPLTDNMSLTPVIEGIGWTVLGGQELVVDAASFHVQSAQTTIMNVYGGLRLGFGKTASIYAGYGRALTGTAWYRDIIRVEVRFIF
jgi:hypothetical protein